MALPAQLQGAFLPTFGLFPQVAFAPTRPPVDCLGNIKPPQILSPTHDLDPAALLARNADAQTSTNAKLGI